MRREVTRKGPRRRARPARVWLSRFREGLAFAIALAALLAIDAPAQVQPAPPDSVRPDTALVPIPPEAVDADTVPAAVQEEAEMEPALVPASLERTLAAGWAAGAWEWSRSDLSTLPGLTLLEFVQRLPGAARFGIGGIGRPEGVTALGMGGGRLRVFVDGYELDPFERGAFELESIPLLDVETVRVTRSLTEMVVDVRTYTLDQPEAHSIVELGTGIYKTRLLRAIFSRGFGSRTTGSGAFDLVTTQGIGLGEPYSHRASVFRLTHVASDRLGFQLDWRNTAIDREGEEYPRATSRSDLVLRATSPLGSGVLLEGILGRSTFADETDADDPLSIRSTQLGLRAAHSSDWSAGEVLVRIRRKSRRFPMQPSFDTEARYSISALGPFRIDASGRAARWEGGSATSGRVTGALSPLPGLTAFGSLEIGSHPIAYFEPATEDESAPVSSLASVDGGGWRAGIEAAAGGSSVGLAAFSSAISSVAPLGLPFDRTLPLTPVADAFGGEVYGRLEIPGTGGALAIDGWYARFEDVSDRPYAPADMGRAAFAYHDIYYDGQLEPHLRIEAVRRGPTRVVAVGTSTYDAIAPAYQTLDVSFQLRIIDVTAFLIWNNILNNRLAVDIPGAIPNYPRIAYGAEWRFRN